MKRILVLLLAAIMCLFLVACGSNGTPNKNSDAQKNESSDAQQDESGTNIEEEQNISYIVNIKVNPEIELHCDNEGNILSLVCLNADAEKATQGISVTGKTLDAGLTDLLLAFHQAGHIKQGGSTVAVTVNRYSSTDNDGSFDDMCNTAMRNFESETKIVLQYTIGMNIYESVEPPVNDPSADDQPQNSQPSDPNTTETTDAEGNRVVTTRDDSGNIRRETVYSPNGTRIRETKYMDDGNKREEEYNLAGVLVYCKTLYSDGSLDERWYYDSGTLKEHVDTKTGYHVHEKYYENGNLSYKYDAQDGSNLDYEETFYDTNGNMTERKWQQTFSGVGYSIRTWHGDTGVSDGYLYNNDGSVWYEVLEGVNWTMKYQVN